jgi:hypothetical protein
MFWAALVLAAVRLAFATLNERVARKASKAFACLRVQGARADHAASRVVDSRAICVEQGSGILSSAENT